MYEFKSFEGDKIPPAAELRALRHDGWQLMTLFFRGKQCYLYFYRTRRD